MRRKRPVCRTAAATRGSTPKRYSLPRPAAHWVVQKAVSHTRLVDAATTGSLQFVEQHPRFFQVGGVEAFGERAVDGGEQLVRFGVSALVAPEPGEARGGAQFVAPSALLAGDRQGGAERVLGLGWIGVRQPSGELAAQAMNFCVPAPRAGDGRFCQCVVQGGKAFLYFSGKRQRLGQQGEE